jgi:hypothetical protein
MFIVLGLYLSVNVSESSYESSPFVYQIIKVYLFNVYLIE